MAQKNLYGKIVGAVFSAIADFLIATNWFNKSYYPNIYFTLGKIIKIILEDKKLKEKQIKKAIFDLKKRKLIDIIQKENEVLVILKEKGKNRVIKYSIKLLLDLKKKQKEWKNLWVAVFFDVPENERKKRDYLRKFLKMIGFYPYQKSVYLFPYECKKEIDLIKKVVDGGEYIKYLIAKEIEDEEKVKKYFNL